MMNQKINFKKLKVRYDRCCIQIPKRKIYLKNKNNGFQDTGVLFKDKYRMTLTMMSIKYKEYKVLIAYIIKNVVIAFKSLYKVLKKIEVNL